MKTQEIVIIVHQISMYVFLFQETTSQTEPSKKLMVNPLSKTRGAITYKKHNPIKMNILVCRFWITGSQLEAPCKRVNKNQNHSN